MIELSDPYWRKLLARAGLTALAAAIIAFAALPTAESAHSGPSNALAAGLSVSEIKWDFYGGMDHARVWVVVNNTAKTDAENLTATLRGIEPSSSAPPQADTYVGTLPRGGSTSITFRVLPGSSATLTLLVANFAPRASLSLAVTAPSGESFPGQPSGSGATLTLTAADIAAGLQGDWKAMIAVSGALRGVSYSLEVASDFGSPSAELSLDALAAGGSYAFSWIVDAAPMPQVLPANVTVDLEATVFDASGQGERVGLSADYVAGSAPMPVGGAAAGGEAFLTAGELLGFTAIGVIGLSVASGALRARGGRARSQDRARPEVSWHRFAWLTVLLVLLVHGLAQLIGGHLYLQAALLGTAATALMAGTIWLNAFQRPRVLAMAWPKWLRAKLLLVAGILLFIALHLALYGRHFAG